jgi:hypothetical protein
MVHLEGAGLSQRVLMRLNEVCSQDEYVGPSIDFSIDDAEAFSGHETLQDAFASICAKALIADTLTFEQHYPTLHVAAWRKIMKKELFIAGSLDSRR